MKSKESKTARQPAVRRKNKPANCPPSAAQSPVSWLSEIIRSRSRLTATIVGCTVIVGLALFLRPSSPDGDEFDIDDIDVNSLPEIIADDLSDQLSEDDSSAGQPGNPQHDSALGRLSVEKTAIGTPVDTWFFQAEAGHQKPGFLKKPRFWDETRQDERIRPASFEAHSRAAPAWLTGTIEEVIGEPAAGGRFDSDDRFSSKQ